MKTKLLMLIALAGLLTGASCPKQQSTTFNTISTTEVAVDAAYKAYLDGVVKGTFITNNVPGVSAKYELFQASERAAIALAQGNTNAPPSPQMVGASVDVLTAITAAKGGK